MKLLNQTLTYFNEIQKICNDTKKTTIDTEEKISEISNKVMSMQSCLSRYLEEAGVVMVSYRSKYGTGEYEGKVVSDVSENKDVEAMEPINTALHDMYESGDEELALSLFIKVSEVCNPNISPYMNNGLCLHKQIDFRTIAGKAFPKCDCRYIVMDRKGGALIEGEGWKSEIIRYNDISTKGTLIVNLSLRAHYTARIVPTKLNLVDNVVISRVEEAAITIMNDKRLSDVLKAVLKPEMFATFIEEVEDSSGDTEYETDSE